MIGLSERLQALRGRLREVIQTYSFTDDEAREAARNGLELTPNKVPGSAAGERADGEIPDDGSFDDAIAEIYHRQMELRRLDQERRLV